MPGPTAKRLLLRHSEHICPSGAPEGSFRVKPDQANHSNAAESIASRAGFGSTPNPALPAPAGAADGPQGPETANGCPDLRRKEPPPRGIGASCGVWQGRRYALLRSARQENLFLLDERLYEPATDRPDKPWASDRRVTSIVFFGDLPGYGRWRLLRCASAARMCTSAQTRSDDYL